MVVEFGELHAAAGARPVVGIEHGIALRGENLRRGGIAGHPPVAVVSLRSAVHHQDQRVALAGSTFQRTHQHALEFESVPGGVGDGLLCRQRPVGEPGIGTRKPPIPVRFAPDVDFARVPRRVGDDGERFGARYRVEGARDGIALRRRAEHRSSVGGQHADLVPQAARAPIPECLGVAPFEPVYVSRVIRGQRANALAVGRGDKDPAGRGVAGILGTHEGDLTAVRRPDCAAELADGLKPEEHFARIRPDEVKLLAHHAVVDAGRRSQSNHIAVAVRPPAEAARRSRQLRGHRLRLVRVQVQDPDPRGARGLPVNHRPKSQVRQLVSLRRIPVGSEKGDVPAIGRR